MNGSDGEIGKVKDFYFDDRHWAIRYLIAETGNWLTGKQVLISPWAFDGIDKEKKHINVNLKKKQIEDSPPLSSDKPVSRQFEMDYYAYYGWPMYWSGRSMWGDSPHIARRNLQMAEAAMTKNSWDPNLRSTHNVDGYRIQANDGDIGHVDDFVIDDDSWAIRYLVIDTRDWFPGKKVLISPHWVEKIDWSESRVTINLSRAKIEGSPEYTDESLASREYEIQLHRHYKRPGYWEAEHDSKKQPNSGSSKEI